MREGVPNAVTKAFDVSRTEPEETDRIREITDKLIEEKQLIVNGVRVNIPS